MRYYDLLVEKLNIPPKGLDEFRVYRLRLVKEVSRSIKKEVFH